MSRVVTLEEFTPGARRDGIAWTGARMEEAATRDGTFTTIETYVFGAGGQPGPDADPKAPQARSFTTTHAALSEGFYRIVFTDLAGHEQPVGPVFVPESGQTYTTIEAVRFALSPDGTQDSSTAAGLSDDELDRAIGEAQSEIDARLAARYDVPFGDVPPVLEAIARDIASWLATLTFRRSDSIDSNDPVQKRYDRAQMLLAKIESGKTVLPVAGTTIGESAEAEVINPYEGDLFSERAFALGPDYGRRIGTMPLSPFDWSG